MNIDEQKTLDEFGIWFKKFVLEQEELREELNELKKTADWRNKYENT